MSIVQISKIQVRSGNIADLPQLSVGEFGWAVDTYQLFIGNDPNVVGPNPDNTEVLTQYSTIDIDAAGANRTIQYNDDGVLSGSSALTWDNDLNALIVDGPIYATDIFANVTIDTLYANSVFANIANVNVINSNTLITAYVIDVDSLNANTINVDTLTSNILITANVIDVDVLNANTINAEAFSSNTLNVETLIANSISANIIESVEIYQNGYQVLDTNSVIDGGTY